MKIRKRIVVKLGSSQIVDTNLKPKLKDLRRLVKQVAQLRKQDKEVVLVSSGAIALGMGELKEHKRPTELSDLQARAAIGQAALMQLYCGLFKEVRLKCAQVLLTRDDLDDKARSLNAKHTLDAILKQGVVPVINENDTTATEEIKFGDNDKLSAMVAELIHADLYVILSDVKGYYDHEKKVLSKVEEITPTIIDMAAGTGNIHIAKGGMKTKIDAVKITTNAGIPSYIAAGSETDVLLRLFKAELVGTYFVEKQ